MKLNPTLNRYDKQHVLRMLQTEREINRIFNDFTRYSSIELRKWQDHKASNVWLRNSTAEKGIDLNLMRLAKALEQAIKKRQKEAWVSANKKNDEIAEAFIENMALSQVAKQGIFARNMDALKAMQDRSDAGLNLSQRVWNITKQTKGNIELFLEAGIATGRSAEEIGRDLRQMLNNPDKRFRRVRNKEGKLVLSQPMKDYHPGPGVYRSSRMNALRVAATETNMAYRVGDSTRWKQMDFILGFEVNRSRNGEPCEICDSLVGKYPTDFIFPGWHPFCICNATPIVMEHKDFAAYLLDGKTPQDKVIKDIPDSAKSWIQEQKDKGRAEPLFVKTNKAFFEKPEPKRRIKTAQQKRDIQKRWNQRVTSRKHENKLKEIAATYSGQSKVIDKLAATIQKDIKAGKSISSIDEAMKTLQHKVQVKIAWEDRREINHLEQLLVDVKELKKQYSMEQITTVYDAVERKLKMWEHLPLEKQKDKLEFEIAWVEENKRYSTWEVGQDAYKKQLAKVNHKLLEVEVDKAIADAMLLKAKSTSNLAKLIAKKEISQSYIDRVYKEIETLEKRRRWARGGKAGELEFKELSERQIAKLLKTYETEAFRTSDKKFRSDTEAVWKILTPEEKFAVTKYTQTFSYLNEPLRSIKYQGRVTGTKEYENDMPIVTKALSKYKMPINTVVRRGTKNFPIPEIGKSLSQLQPGDVFTDKAFLSTAIHRDKGFREPYNLIIVVPKGAQGLYAEPFSHYTDDKKFSYSTGRLWDGKSKETLKSEMEWIGQRGSRLKVIKRDGNNIYMQMIGQMQ